MQIFEISLERNANLLNIYTCSMEPKYGTLILYFSMKNCIPACVFAGRLHFCNDGTLQYWYTGVSVTLCKQRSYPINRNNYNNVIMTSHSRLMPYQTTILGHPGGCRKSFRVNDLRGKVTDYANCRQKCILGLTSIRTDLGIWAECRFFNWHVECIVYGCKARGTGKRTIGRHWRIDATRIPGLGGSE